MNQALTTAERDFLVAAMGALYRERVEIANNMERSWGFGDERTQLAWANARATDDVVRSISAKLQA